MLQVGGFALGQAQLVSRNISLMLAIFGLIVYFVGSHLVVQSMKKAP